MRWVVGKAGILQTNEWEVALCKKHARQSVKSPNSSSRVNLDPVGGYIGLVGS